MTEAGLDCIAIQSLGHDTALGRGAGRAGARRQALGHAGRRAGRRRRRAAGAGVQVGARVLGEQA